MRSTSGARTLRQVRRDHRALNAACLRCDRAGRYRVETLFERLGPDVALPDVAAAPESGCARKGQIGGCFVVFPDAAPAARHS
jgi:hypothetical protein